MGGHHGRSSQAIGAESGVSSTTQQLGGGLPCEDQVSDDPIQSPRASQGELMDPLQPNRELTSAGGFHGSCGTPPSGASRRSAGAARLDDGCGLGGIPRTCPPICRIDGSCPSLDQVRAENRGFCRHSGAERIGPRVSSADATSRVAAMRVAAASDVSEQFANGTIPEDLDRTRQRTWGPRRCGPGGDLGRFSVLLLVLP